ncbi:MAG: ATP-binding cassette domain-containing protein, partial [Clostridiales bacterium]|nr:ATP-binding cassette domain-containing protein [Clostridiales bacterium]
MGVLLHTKNVSKYYGGIKAVQNIDMQVEQGEIFGIIGPNGAGKT